ncbi:MAG: hypothetical protein AAFY11_04615 [Cyanobacteria bacterium J06641_5]
MRAKGLAILPLLLVWSLPVAAFDVDLDWGTGKDRQSIRLEAERDRLRLEGDRLKLEAERDRLRLESDLLDVDADLKKRRLEIGQAESDRVAIQALIDENLRTFNIGDLDAHMATIDPSSPAYESTRALAVGLSSRFDLEATLEGEPEFINVDGDTARVRVTQVTRERSGAPGFRDNRVRVVHELRRIAGDWKIFNAEIEQVTYL